MRIASRFQRSGRLSERRRRALVAGVWVGLISFGCLFELEPLEEPDGGIGGVGPFGGGEGGSPPVAGNAGSGAGGAVSLVCNNMPGQKLCGETCVPAGPENGCNDPACTPCAQLPNAALPTCGGDSGRCQITSCTAGYADCDGDLLSYNAGQSVDLAAAAAGCEYSFGEIADSPQPLAVERRALIRLDDNSRDDWSGIPAYRVGETCVACVDNNVVFQPSAQNEAPPNSDLDAYFRVAWDANNFYVLAEAFDDSVFSEGSSVDIGGCQTSGDNYVPGPVCEDAFVLYFDGAPEAARNGNFGNAAHRIYLGTSGGAFLPAQGQPPPRTINVQVLPQNGPHCYRIEAQFPWTFLVSSQQPVDGKFPPAAEQIYGFDMAVSDFDPSVSDANVFELQSRLFWNERDAQSSLQSIAGVGDIILKDHSPSGDATSPQ